MAISLVPKDLPLEPEIAVTRTSHDGHYCTMHCFDYHFLILKNKTAPHFLDLITTLVNLRGWWLLEKKINSVPCQAAPTYRHMMENNTQKNLNIHWNLHSWPALAFVISTHKKIGKYLTKAVTISSDPDFSPCQHHIILNIYCQAKKDSSWI